VSAHLDLHRARIVAAVERLIAVLDQMDADPDHEPEPADDDAENEALLQPVTLAPARMPRGRWHGGQSRVVERRRCDQVLPGALCLCPEALTSIC
jgi:hypothetical protein